MIQLNGQIAVQSNLQRHWNKIGAVNQWFKYRFELSIYQPGWLRNIHTERMQKIDNLDMIDTFLWYKPLAYLMRLVSFYTPWNH